MHIKFYFRNTETSKDPGSAGAIPKSSATSAKPSDTPAGSTERKIIYVLFPEPEGGLHALQMNDMELNQFKLRCKDKEVIIMKSDLTAIQVFQGQSSSSKSFQDTVTSSLVTPLFMTTEGGPEFTSTPEDNRIGELEAKLELRNQQYVTLDRMYVATQTRLNAALRELQRQR